MMTLGRRRVFALGSWAPFLRTQLNGVTKPCGCLVGVYLSWGGAQVAAIDQAHQRCPDGHRERDILNRLNVSAPAPLPERR